MKVSEQEQQEYDVAFAKWCEEALPVLKSEYPDEYEKIEAKAKKGRVSRSISAVKDAVRKGLIQRDAYFNRRKQEVMPLIEQVYGPITKVDVSKKSDSTYYYTAFGKVLRLILPVDGVRC